MDGWGFGLCLAEETREKWMTSAELLTFGGATVAVVVVSAVAHRLLGRVTLWIPVVLSLSYVVGTQLLTSRVGGDADPFPIRVVLAVVNACLLFAAATGANEILAKPAPTSAKKKELDAGTDGTFRVSWLR